MPNAPWREAIVIVVETPRLLLRSLKLGDLSALRVMHSDPEVMGRYRYQRVLTQSETEEFVDDTIERYLRDRCGQLIATLKPAGTVIGHCGLEWMDIDGSRELELGYLIARPYWGQGLATEASQGLMRYAFTQLGAERVVAHTLDDNPASRRVLEKLGMRFQRHRVPAGLRERRFYVLERADWAAISPTRI
jgi:RimJ/RimL family protein N-acetyltransferase